MNDFIEKGGYAPTLLQFDDITIDMQGYYNLTDKDVVVVDSTEYLDQTIGSLAEMENIIKKNFMLAPEKLKDFAENNPT